MTLNKSVECAKYGHPNNNDVFDVWGEVIDKPGLEDYFDQFGKLIWKGQQVSARHSGDKQPLTAMYLTFGRIRLWIDEHITNCYDAAKVASKFMELFMNNFTTLMFLRFERHFCEGHKRCIPSANLGQQRS